MLIRNSVLLALLFLLHSGTSQSVVPQGVVLEYGKPSSVNVSEERLERIDDMCKEAISNGQIPGIVALVARNGKIVYHKAFGTADADGRKLQYNDIFRIASQNSHLTPAAGSVECAPLESKSGSGFAVAGSGRSSMSGSPR